MPVSEHTRRSYEGALRRFERSGRSGTDAGVAAYLGDIFGEGRTFAVAAISWEEADRTCELAEIAALDVGDVDLTEQAVAVWDPGADEEGTVYFVGETTVRRVRVWIEAAGLTEGALLRPINKSGRLREGRLTEQSIQRIIIRRARDAGVQGRISGNSLRVGSAQNLTNAGATLAEMQSAGRWRSAVMPVSYAQEKRPRQDAVTRLRYGR